MLRAAVEGGPIGDYRRRCSRKSIRRTAPAPVMWLRYVGGCAMLRCKAARQTRALLPLLVPVPLLSSCPLPCFPASCLPCPTLLSPLPSAVWQSSTCPSLPSSCSRPAPAPLSSSAVSLRAVRQRTICETIEICRRSHSADTPSRSLLKHLLQKRGVQQTCETMEICRRSHCGSSSFRSSAVAADNGAQSGVIRAILFEDSLYLLHGLGRSAVATKHDGAVSKRAARLRC